MWYYSYYILYICICMTFCISHLTCDDSHADKNLWCGKHSWMKSCPPTLTASSERCTVTTDAEERYDGNSLRERVCVSVCAHFQTWGCRNTPIILKQSCVTARGLRAPRRHDRWRPLITPAPQPEIDVQKFKSSSSVLKIKAARQG